MPASTSKHQQAHAAGGHGGLMVSLVDGPPGEKNPIVGRRGAWVAHCLPGPHCASPPLKSACTRLHCLAQTGRPSKALGWRNRRLRGPVAPATALLTPPSRESCLGPQPPRAINLPARKMTASQRPLAPFAWSREPLSPLPLVFTRAASALSACACACACACAWSVSRSPAPRQAGELCVPGVSVM